MQANVSSAIRLIKALDERIAQAPTLYIRLGNYVDEPKITVSMMDWIACYLTDGEDSAAAAMSLDNNTRVTLHIGCNNGVPSPVNINKASKLATAIQSLAMQSIPSDERNRYNVVRNLLISMCWPAVWSKIVAIRGILDETRAMDRFESIIQKWSKYCQEENRPLNSSPRLNMESERKEKNVVNTFKRLLEELRRNIDGESDATKSAQADWRVKAFDDLGLKCEVLLYSDIIMSALNYGDRDELPQNSLDYCSDSSDGHGHEEAVKELPDPYWLETLDSTSARLLQRFVNAVQEFYQYYNGALMLGTYGTKYFRDCWGPQVGKVPFERLFTVVWVHKEYELPHSISCKFEELPMVLATSWFNNYTKDVKKLTSDELKILEPICKGLWKKDETITGKVHEEMAMALYLIARNLKVHHKAVGVSSPPCYTCGLFYRHMAGAFRVRKMSHTVSTDWILPSLLDHPSVTTDLRHSVVGLRAAFINVASDFLEDTTGKSQRVPNLDPRHALSNIAMSVHF